eukprot:6407009-Ditylum_brightwellii.AAC.1
MFKQIEFRPTSPSILTTDLSAFVPLPDDIAHVAKKFIFSPHCPEAPLHMGEFTQSLLKTEWKASVFENYEEMTTSAIVLRAQPAFKVNLHDQPNMYELYTRTVDNDSSQVQGIDFDASNAPTSSFENIRFILTIAVAMNLTLKFNDTSNAFQQNMGLGLAKCEEIYVVASHKIKKNS